MCIIQYMLMRNVEGRKKEALQTATQHTRYYHMACTVYNEWFMLLCGVQGEGSGQACCSHEGRDVESASEERGEGEAGGEDESHEGGGGKEGQGDGQQSSTATYHHHGGCECTCAYMYMFLNER